MGFSYPFRLPKHCKIPYLLCPFCEIFIGCTFSRQFGFLKLNSPEQAKKKALVLKAVKYLERMLIQAQEEKEDIDSIGTKEISIDPKTYCKLGHFHLLLEDYSKGESTSFD